MLHGKDDKSDKPKFEVDGFEVGGTEEEPKGEEAANIAFKAMGGGVDFKEKPKENLEAHKIDPLVCWINNDYSAEYIQIIIPNISSVSALVHYQNEVKEDRWKFAINYNSMSRMFVYEEIDMAYRKYNELIDKITNCWTKYRP